MKKTAALVAVVAGLALVATAGARATSSGSCRVAFYAGGQFYTGTVTRSYRTSCPFARNVTRASLRYIIRAGGVGDGDFYTSAWSPVTFRWYRVHCWAHGDLGSFTGMRVDCRAGIGARVIYTAHRH